MRDLFNVAMSLGPAAVILVVLAIFVLPLAVRILREYERGVIFRLGKLLDVKGPGPHLSHPPRGQDGENRLAHRHHRCGAAGNHDPRQRAGHRGRGHLFSHHQSVGRRGESGEFLDGDVAHRANDAAQRAWAKPRWKICCHNAM